MNEAILAYINSLMESLAIPYAFMEWKSKPPDDRYYVGEASELAMTTMEEDGRQDTTLYLRGFTRGEWSALSRDAENIRKSLPHTAILEDGSGIAVFYGGASFVPTGDAEIKSIKINLDIKEWRVN